MKRLVFFVSIFAFAGLLLLQDQLISNKQPLKIPGAYNALVQWNSSRAYPNESFPSEGYYDAFKKMKAHSVDSKTTEGEWEPMGPNNTAGRALEIAINPNNGNEVWLGTASGGLWKTETGGEGIHAWQYISTGLPVLGVSAIAFAPSDPSIIYAGTGEVYNHEQVGNGAAYRETRGSYGIGILKSNNGGKNWGLTLDWSANQGRGVNDIKIDSNDPSKVWAGTTEGVYHSTNGGTTWELILDKKMVTDLVLIPNTETVIAIAGNLGHEDQGIYRTTNDGASWSRIESGVPDFYNGKGQLALSPSNPDIIYASIGENFWSDSPTNPGISWLCKSTDAGATWSIVNTTDYAKWQGWFSHDVAVDPTDPEHIYVIGIDIWESINGGASLILKSEGGLTLGQPEAGLPDGDEFYSHSDHHDVKIDPNNPDRVFFANDGGVFFSDDGADSFRSVNGGLQTTQFYSGFSSSPLDQNFAAGGLQDNSSVIYSGQPEWRRVVGGDGSWTAISSEDPDVVYVSWQFLNMRRSTTRGVTNIWSNTTPPTNFANPTTASLLTTTSFIAPYVLCPSSPDVLYAGRNIVYKSLDAGSNWSATNGGDELNGNPAYSMAVSPQSADKLYVTTIPRDKRPTAHVTSDGGNTFSDITAGLPNRYLLDLAVDPFNDDIAYVTIGGFGTAHLYKTTNAGNNWIAIGDDLPDVPTSAVAIDPANVEHVYVGNDLGVFFSENGGESFVPWNQGLFTDAVLVVDLSVSPVNQKLRIASHGNGAFERDLVSENVNVGIEQSLSLQLYPNPSSDKVFVKGLNESQNYSVHNLLGVTLRKGNFGESQAIDISTLLSGQYLLRIEDENGSWQTERFVKQ